MKNIIKKLKRGFTIVELVIVIAVIAILAAVLIPTFANLINNAEESNDMITVSNLNKIVSAYDTVGEVETVNDALDAALENGYSVSNLTPTSEGNVIVYDANSKRFALLSDDYATVVYKDSTTTKDAAEDWQTSTTWRFVTTSDVDVNSEGYYDLTEEGISYILVGTGNEWDGKNVKTSYGVALYDYTGNVTLGSVVVENEDDETNQQTIKSEGTSNSKSTVAKTTIADGTKVTSIIVNVKAAYLSCNASVYTIKNYSTTTITKVVGDSKLSEYGTTSIYDASEITTGKIYNYNNNISEDVIVKVAEGITSASSVLVDNTNSITVSNVKTTTVEITVTTTSTTISIKVGNDEIIDSTDGNIKINTEDTLFNSVGISTAEDMSKLTSEDGGYYLLTDNIDLTSQIVIAANANVTLDLNGKTLTVYSTSKAFQLSKNSTFTITDSSKGEKGTLISDADKAWFIDVETNDSTFNFERGTIQQNYKQIVVYVRNGGSFNMTGGTIYAPNGGPSGKGIVDCESASSSINISGGTIDVNNTSSSYYTIYVTYGTLNISGDCSINGSWVIGVISGATADISGGTITANNRAIHVNGSKESLMPTVNVSGGIISGTKYGIYCNNYTNVIVTGGTINSIYFATATSAATVSKSVSTTVDVYKNGTLNTSGKDDPTADSIGYTCSVEDANAYAYIERSGERENFVSLSAAVTGAENGETIYLAKDSTNWVVTNKTLTIDLCGYNIASASNYMQAIVVNSGANITIKNSAGGNSTISCYDYADAIAIWVKHGATVTIEENVTVTSTSSSTVFVGVSNNTADNVATLNVYGTITNTGSGYAITGNGTDKVGGTAINIYEGATVTSDSAVAIYHPQYGTLTIKGGTISGYGVGVQMCGGSLYISGATTVISSTISSEDLASNVNNIANKSGDGPIFDGAAVSIINRSGYVGITKVEITNGTFTSASGEDAIQVYSFDTTNRATDWAEQDTYVTITVKY